MKVFHEIKTSLKEGMGEVDGRKMSLSIFSDHGVSKHWHQPYIRFGEGTAHSFHEPLNKNNKLLPDTQYYIDLGPVWKDFKTGIEYEVDYGDTFVYGQNLEAENCVLTAHQIFNEAKLKWSKEDFSGEN